MSNSESSRKISYQELEAQLIKVQNELAAEKKNAKEKEQLLTETGSIAKVGGWKFDLKTNKLTWTREVYSIHEVNKDFEPTVEKAVGFYNESSKQNIQNALEKAIRTGNPFDTNLKIKTAKGNIKDVRSVGKVILNDEGLPDIVFGTFQDITDKIKKELELKESQERFNLAMNASRDGLFDWNLITNEIYYSPGWKKMLGYKDDELPNDFSIWEKLTKPEDIERSWKMQQELISKQRDRFEMEFKMKHKNGHWIDVLSRAEAVFNDKEKAIRIVGTI